MKNVDERGRPLPMREIKRPRQPEVSPNKAAKILGINRKTALRWCRLSLAGEDSPFKRVRRTVGGYYRIDAADVRALLQAAQLVQPGQ